MTGYMHEKQTYTSFMSKEGATDDGNAPATDTIHPGALKAARKRRNMTQERLAEEVGSTKDTVSRWERGTTRRIRARLREKLCKVLEVGRLSLTEPPRRSKEPEELPGYVHMRFRIAKKVQTAFRLVTMRYNVAPHDVTALVPLLFLIVAGCLDQGLGHLKGRVASRNSHGKNPEDDERVSVEFRDIFGRKLATPEWDA